MTTKRRLLGLLGATALAPLAAVAGQRRPAVEQTASTPFPNFILETHEGKSVRFYDDLLKDKVVAINMMYTVCTGICPTSTANLLQVQQMLGDRVGKDVFMYSLSLQPELDRPRALSDYMKQYGIKRGWTYLTGKRGDIETLRRMLGFYDSDPLADANIGNHTGMVRVGNVASERWCMVPALGTPRHIVRAILEI